MERELSKKLILIMTLVLIVLIYFSIDFWESKIPQIFSGTEYAVAQNPVPEPVPEPFPGPFLEPFPGPFPEPVTGPFPEAVHNVSGWAWSENIGWISFNCNNPELADPRCRSNYGVNIDLLTGLFSGYSWSENIGWITFNKVELSGCPDAPCQARVDLNNYQVSGWARALAYGSGWDGWIKLRGTNYGVLIDTITRPAEFRDWAWSDMVIGWISFNCKEGGYNEVTKEVYDICSTSNYKVFVDLGAPEGPPVVTNAIIDGEPAYCNILPGVGQISFSWTYNDPDSDPQAKYHLQIATDSGFTNFVVNSTNSQGVLPGGTGTSAVQVKTNPTPSTDDLDIAYGSTYYWRVRVKDVAENWSGFANGNPFSFTTPFHAYPWIDFTWFPQSPSVEELVQFVDQSICYDADGLCNSWHWDFPSDWQFEEDYNLTNQNPLGKFTTRGEKDVYLTVTDSDGFSCRDKKPITSQLPLPEWKEIAPF